MHSPAKFDVLHAPVTTTAGGATGAARWGVGVGHEQTGETVPPSVIAAAQPAGGADLLGDVGTGTEEIHHDFDTWDGDVPPGARVGIRVEDPAAKEEDVRHDKRYYKERPRSYR